MTLHITRGLLLTGPAADMFALSAAMRPTLRGVAEDLYYAVIAGTVARHIDATRCGKPGGLDNIRGLPDLVRAAQHRTSSDVTEATLDQVRRNPEFDLGVSVKVLAHPARRDALLAIVSTEHSEYTQALLALDGVQDYSWYSCETPPVPTSEWDDRRATWTAALREGRSSDLGWTWSLVGNMPGMDLPFLRAHLDRDRVIAALPDEHDRAQALAGALVVLDPDVDVYTAVSQFMDRQREQLPHARAALRPITTADLTTT